MSSLLVVWIVGVQIIQIIRDFADPNDLTNNLAVAIHRIMFVSTCSSVVRHTTRQSQIFWVDLDQGCSILDHQQSCGSDEDECRIWY